MQDSITHPNTNGEIKMVTVREISIGDIPEENYVPVEITTTRGGIQGRYYPGSKKSYQAVLWVGGENGGWESPAQGLYPLLAEDLQINEDIASLRIRYRNPEDKAECVVDTIVGIAMLAEEGIKEVALVGHSSGGSIVIQAGAVAPEVKTIVTLASHKDEANAVKDLHLGKSLLLIHGTGDSRIPANVSATIHDNAKIHKRLRLYTGAGHELEEVAFDVYEDLHGWLVKNLKQRSN